MESLAKRKIYVCYFQCVFTSAKKVCTMICTNIEFIYHRQNNRNFRTFFEQNATINFEPIFEKKCGPIFGKNANFECISEKRVNFKHFVNGR